MTTTTPNSVYKIRFSDCDLFGHLNNARYIDYFMNAREDHLKEYYDLSLTDYYKKGIAWVVSSHEIAYLRAAVYEEPVTIQTSLLFADSDSLHVELVMMDAAQTQLKAIMRTRFTPIHPQTGKRKSHPADFLEWAKTIENTKVDHKLSLSERIKDIVRNCKEKEVV